MSIGIWFWIIFVITLILHIWASWPWGRSSSVLVVWILLFLLGLGVFGSPLQDSGPRVVHDNPPVEVIHTR